MKKHIFKLTVIFPVIILCGVFGVAKISLAATYFIDYASGSDSNSGQTASAPWKHAPGMVGSTMAYGHSAGDLFLFKGGVTWPSAALPMSIGYSGSVGNVDTYRVATPAEWSGSAGFAKFDGEGSDTNLLSASGKNYFRISGFDFSRNNTGDYKAVDLDSCGNMEIDHNHMQAGTWIGFYYHSGSNVSNVNFHDNDIENVAMGIVVAASAAITIDGVNIHDNSLHDFAPAIRNGRHGDGIHLWGSGASAAWIIQNVRIYNNNFYGDFLLQDGVNDMTGFIFMENTIKNTLIYNNVLAPTNRSCPTGFSVCQGYIVLSQSPAGADFGYLYVANNTLVGNASCPGYAGSAIDTSSFQAASVTHIVNNIFENIRYPYYMGSINTGFAQIDNNIATPISGWHLGAYTLANWVSATPYDDNALAQAAGLASNYQLQSDSVAINRGIDLSAYFNTDESGLVRPQGSGWDIGAYEYQSGGTVDTAPAAPKGLSVN